MTESSCRKNLLPWVIWGLGAIFYCHQYFLRVSVSSLAPDLVANFHINAITLSSVAAMFYYAFMLMQVPCGLLIDRFGPRARVDIVVTFIKHTERYLVDPRLNVFISISAFTG